MQNQHQIWKATSILLPLAIIKVLLWRRRDFLGRNSTACLNLNCICLLIHRAILLQCQQEPASYLKESRGRQLPVLRGEKEYWNFSGIPQHFGWLVREVQGVFPLKKHKPSLHVCTCSTWKSGEGWKQCCEHMPDRSSCSLQPSSHVSCCFVVI